VVLWVVVYNHSQPGAAYVALANHRPTIQLLLFSFPRNRNTSVSTDSFKLLGGENILGCTTPSVRLISFF
jgi:hypothetical protein